MSVGVLAIGKQTWESFGRNKGTRLGAALAYYTFASFFPLLLVLISLIGIILSFNIGGAHDSSVVVVEMVSEQLPAAEELLEDNLEQTEQNSGIIGLIGLLTGLWAASNIFAQLEDAFVEIYDVSPEGRNWKKTLKARGKAASIVLLLALMMVSSLVLSTVLQTTDELIGALPGGGYWVWLLNLALSLGLTGLVFAVLFKYLPDKVVTWKAALIGGMFTSLTWLIGRELLSAWLGNGSGATAGSVVGAVLAFLALIYYAWQILLLGAQLTATYDDLVNPHLVHRDWKPAEEASDNKTDVVVQKPMAHLPSANVMPALPAPEASTKKWQAVSAVPARRSSPISFGAGFFTGLMALFIGIQMLMNKLLKPKTTSHQAE